MAKPSRVSDLKRLAKENKSKKVTIFNPDIDDFIVKYGPKEYKIYANDFGEFSFTIANHIKKHLAVHLRNKRGIKYNAELDLKNIYKEIEAND